MVTEAPADTPVTIIGRAATADLSTVVFVPVEGARGKAGIASDALHAMGKRDDVTGKPRHATGIAEMLPLWLNAHRTDTLIAAACQRTPAADLLALVEMTQATGANLVFATDHGYGDTLTRALAAAAPQPVAWDETVANATDNQRWTTEPPGTATGTDPDPGTVTGGGWKDREPTLPAVEYWTFYATAKRQLTPTEFAPIHDLYRDTLDRLDTWFHTLHDAEADLTVDLAHGSVKTLIEEQTTFDHVTVVTRATQAAYHQRGWFLDIDERELRNGLIRFPPAQTTPDLYDRLRAYYEPSRAGTVALYLAGATPEAIRATTVYDLAQWHHNPHQPVADQTIPGQAAPYLRAALLARAIDGAHPDDPAFPGHRRRILLDLRQAATDLDLNVGEATLNETHSIGNRRVPTSIVKLERLT